MRVVRKPPVSAPQIVAMTPSVLEMKAISSSVIPESRQKTSSIGLIAWSPSLKRRMKASVAIEAGRESQWSSGLKTELRSAAASSARGARRTIGAISRRKAAPIRYIGIQPARPARARSRPPDPM